MIFFCQIFTFSKMIFFRKNDLFLKHFFRKNNHWNRSKYVSFCTFFQIYIRNRRISERYVHFFIIFAHYKNIVGFCRIFMKNDLFDFFFMKKIIFKKWLIFLFWKMIFFKNDWFFYFENWFFSKMIDFFISKNDFCPSLIICFLKEICN